MKETELRIGNYVLGKRYPEDDGEIILVNSVDDSGINLEVGYGGEGITREFYHDDIFPIPLTPEILRKADVSNFPFELFYVGGRYHIALENGSWVFIESMHQLQNLYFALTGEELTINL